MNTVKARATHDLTCPPSCLHFKGLFDVGATEEWVIRDYRVTLEDENGRPLQIRVRASGQRDAINQALFESPGCVFRRVSLTEPA